MLTSKALDLGIDGHLRSSRYVTVEGPSPLWASVSSRTRGLDAAWGSREADRRWFWVSGEGSRGCRAGWWERRTSGPQTQTPARLPRLSPATTFSPSLAGPPDKMIALPP